MFSFLLVFLETFSQLISYWLFSTLVSSFAKSNIGQLPFQSICDQQGFLALLHSSKSTKSRQQAQHLCLTLKPTGGCSQWKRMRSKFLFFQEKKSICWEKTRHLSGTAEKEEIRFKREQFNSLYLIYVKRASGRPGHWNAATVCCFSPAPGRKEGLVWAV